MKLWSGSIVAMRNFSIRILIGLMCINMSAAVQDHGYPIAAAEASSLWAHDNLMAWCVAPFDAKSRDSEERARMLEGLGFKSYAYLWFDADRDPPRFSEEIEAMQRHRIDLVAWWFPFEADDPAAKVTLEKFRRYNIHPQLWVTQLSNAIPKTADEWAEFLPKGLVFPRDREEFQQLSQKDKAAIQSALRRIEKKGWPKTPEQREQQVNQVVSRIRALAKLAAPYGSPIALYNHNGWFGVMDNQVTIIQRLKQLGVADVGIVYNFSHARDELHDDTMHFPKIWRKIRPYVIAVNITGTAMDGNLIYPSQGDRELDMMRIIEESRWRGPIGLIAEKGGDAEVTLRNDIAGLDWLAAELQMPGSAGPRPFSKIR